MVDLGFFWSRIIEQQLECALRPTIPNPPFYGLEFQFGKIQRKHSQWETAAGEGVVPAAACKAVRRKSEELTLVSYWRKDTAFGDKLHSLAMTLFFLHHKPDLYYFQSQHIT